MVFRENSIVMGIITIPINKCAFAISAHAGIHSEIASTAGGFLSPCMWQAVVLSSLIIRTSYNHKLEACATCG